MGSGDFRGQAGEFFAVAFEEAGPLEQIERKIAADAEFGEDGEVGAAGFGLAGQLQDAGGIAAKSPTVGLNWARAIFIRRL